jgi:hypothetical protein
MYRAYAGLINYIASMSWPNKAIGFSTCLGISTLISDSEMATLSSFRASSYVVEGGLRSKPVFSTYGVLRN